MHGIPSRLSFFFFAGIDLKKASKSFAQHFSCGSSVTGDDEIVIQGDVSDDVIDFIQGKWPEVSKTHIFMYSGTSINDHLQRATTRYIPAKSLGLD